MCLRGHVRGTRSCERDDMIVRVRVRIRVRVTKENEMRELV